MLSEDRRKISPESQVFSAGKVSYFIPKVCRDCAACFELMRAKWPVFSCAAKCFRAGFVNVQVVDLSALLHVASSSHRIIGRQSSNA